MLPRRCETGGPRRAPFKSAKGGPPVRVTWRSRADEQPNQPQEDTMFNDDPVYRQTMRDAGRDPDGGQHVGPRVFSIMRSDVDACPIRSLLPEHYRDDGTCLCHPPAHTCEQWVGTFDADGNAEACGRPARFCWQHNQGGGPLWLCDEHHDALRHALVAPLTYIEFIGATGLERESYEAKVAYQDFTQQDRPVAEWWASHQGEYV